MLNLSNSITSQLLWPYMEDVTRFDFEIPEAGNEVLQKLASISLELNQETE